eukprot:1157587-Pelagomonas_calceolata.AAC.9
MSGSNALNARDSQCHLCAQVVAQVHKVASKLSMHPLVSATQGPDMKLTSQKERPKAPLQTNNDLRPQLKASLGQGANSWLETSSHNTVHHMTIAQYLSF